MERDGNASSNRDPVTKLTIRIPQTIVRQFLACPPTQQPLAPQQIPSNNGLISATPAQLPSMPAKPDQVQEDEDPVFDLSYDPNLFELNSDELDEAFKAWLFGMPDSSTELLYLVTYDPLRCKHLTFTGVKKNELVRTYLMYLVHDATTPEYSTIRTEAQKLPENDIRPVGQSYVLACIIKGCQYAETQLSVEELKVRMFLHQLIEHQRDSKWYYGIESRIKQNFEEALGASKGGIE